MYPACAILATDFNFLVWFIQQSDHCPKLALQKSLMHLSYPFRDCSWWSSREAQVSILLIRGPHQQPQEPCCVMPNWAINSQSNVQCVEGVMCLRRQEGLLLLPHNTACLFFCAAGEGPLGNRAARSLAPLIEMLVLSMSSILFGPQFPNPWRAELNEPVYHSAL